MGEEFKQPESNLVEVKVWFLNPKRSLRSQAISNCKLCASVVGGGGLR